MLRYGEKYVRLKGRTPWITARALCAERRRQEDRGARDPNLGSLSREGIKSRGDITVWFSEDATDAWTPPKNGRRGGQPRYSNLAIVMALTLRIVLRLPLRQTEGFLDSLLRLMDLDLKALDHTTLSRRNKNVDVPSPTRTWSYKSKWFHTRDGRIHYVDEGPGDGAPVVLVHGNPTRVDRALNKAGNPRASDISAISLLGRYRTPFVYLLPGCSFRGKARGFQPSPKRTLKDRR